MRPPSDAQSLDPRPRVPAKAPIHENRFNSMGSVLAGFGPSRREHFVSVYGRRVGILVTRGRDVLISNAPGIDALKNRTDVFHGGAFDRERRRGR